MKGIVQIIEDSKAGHKNQKVLEFDLNTLEDIKCRQLEDYVNACLAKQQNEEIEKKKANMQTNGQQAQDARKESYPT